MSFGTSQSLCQLTRRSPPCPWHFLNTKKALVKNHWCTHDPRNFQHKLTFRWKRGILIGWNWSQDLEQPIRMLKFQCRVIWGWYIFIGQSPSFRWSVNTDAFAPGVLLTTYKVAWDLAFCHQLLKKPSELQCYEYNARLCRYTRTINHECCQ